MPSDPVPPGADSLSPSDLSNAGARRRLSLLHLAVDNREGRAAVGGRQGIHFQPDGGVGMKIDLEVFDAEREVRELESRLRFAPSGDEPLLRALRMILEMKRDRLARLQSARRSVA